MSAVPDSAQAIQCGNPQRGRKIPVRTATRKGFFHLDANLSH
jgi:hypothetical protein